jgi:hypothetical protein
MLIYVFYKTKNYPISFVYKLQTATAFTACKKVLSVMCFLVIGFYVIGSKLGLYSPMVALLCRNVLQ